MNPSGSPSIRARSTSSWATRWVRTPCPWRARAWASVSPTDTDLTEPVATANDTQRPHREHAATHDTDQAPADDRRVAVAAQAMIRPGGRSNTDHDVSDTDNDVGQPTTPADTAEHKPRGAPGHRQGGVDVLESWAPATSERVQENEKRAADGPRRDTRDVAAAEPRPRDHDVVRVPEPDETTTELARARRALAEITDRRHLEHQHDQHDRDHQLAQWHTDDRDPATTGSEQPTHDADDTNHQ